MSVLVLLHPMLFASDRWKWTIIQSEPRLAIIRGLYWSFACRDYGRQRPHDWYWRGWADWALL